MIVPAAAAAAAAILAVFLVKRGKYRKQPELRIDRER